MKLLDLNPRAVLWGDDSTRRGMGLSFDCPGCRKVRIVIPYANPQDGRAAALPTSIPENASPELKERVRQQNLRWQRTGDSFENLSLTPSIDASQSGHWHGFVTSGQISGVGKCTCRN